MKHSIATFFLVVVVLTSACERIYKTDGPVSTRVVSIPDPQGLRQHDYTLAETGLSAQLLTDRFVQWKDVPRIEINTPEDAKNEFIDLTQQYNFDFSNYRYDYLGIQLADPSWGSRLLKSEYSSGERELHFGVYHNQNAGIVPAVVVTQTYLFQYPKSN